MSLFKKSRAHTTVVRGQSIEDDERRTSRLLITLMSVAVMISLLWAATFDLDEITRGTGKVIPIRRRASDQGR